MMVLILFNYVNFRNIQYDKLLTNFVRDDVALFNTGEVNVIEIYDNLFQSLKEFEDDNVMRFNSEYIEEETGCC